MEDAGYPAARAHLAPHPSCASACARGGYALSKHADSLPAKGGASYASGAPLDTLASSASAPFPPGRRVPLATRPSGMSAYSPANPLATAASTSASKLAAQACSGMHGGQLVLPEGTGSAFPVLRGSKPLRRIASIYNEVTTESRHHGECGVEGSVGGEPSPRAADGDAPTTPCSGHPAAAARASHSLPPTPTSMHEEDDGGHLAEAGRELVKEDTLKALMREAADLGSALPASSDLGSQPSGFMRAPRSARGASPARAAHSPSPRRAFSGGATAAAAAALVAQSAVGATQMDPMTFMARMPTIAKEPTLAMMCADVPAGSWDPLMTFPVLGDAGQQKEGSGEHPDPLPHIPPHQRYPPQPELAAQPALRIEVLNTGTPAPRADHRSSRAGDAAEPPAAPASPSSTSGRRGPAQARASPARRCWPLCRGSREGLRAETSWCVQGHGAGKAGGETCMADMFANLNAQSHAFSSDDTATMVGDGNRGFPLSEMHNPTLAEHSADCNDDMCEWPTLGQEASFPVPDVLERSGDFGTKPLKALVSSGLWKMDTADIATLELDMAAMDKSSSGPSDGSASASPAKLVSIAAD